MSIFWKTHNPDIKPLSRQYWSAIYYHNEEQKSLALKTKQFEEIKRKAKIYTKIVPLTTFYLAEDYHQKYILRHHNQIIEQLEALYPSAEEFINSTLVARINGYFGGFIPFEALQLHLRALNLSKPKTENLLSIIDNDKK